MWLGWSKRAPIVELVLGSQQASFLGGHPSIEHDRFDREDDALAALAALPPKTPVQVWLTGGLISSTVLDPPPELATSEWLPWLRHMASQVFGPASGVADIADEWVLWCSARKPAHCRLVGLKSSLLERLTIACERLELRRVAPLWTSLEESLALAGVHSASYSVYDGEQSHILLLRAGGECEVQISRDCDWESCLRWHRRRRLAEAAMPPSLWRWERPSGAESVSAGWRCMEAA